MKRGSMFLARFVVLGVTLVAGGAVHAQDSWKEQHFDDCRCTATFPGSPETTSQKMPSKDGNLDSKMLVLQLPKPNETFYAIAYVDYPKDAIARSSVDDRLNGVRDGAVAKVKGTLKSESKISLGGFPGRELTIEAPNDLLLVARIYFVNQRLYHTLVVAKKALAEQADARKFLDGFKVDKS